VTHCRILTTAVLLVAVQSVALGQWPPRVSPPSSDVASETREALDRIVELGEIDTTLGELDEVLSERLDGIPVFVDAKGVKTAELSLGDELRADVGELPMRSALRKLLAPLGLRAVVEEEGLVITADFAALTRRGIATDRWVESDSPTSQRFKNVLDAPFSASLVEIPLLEAIASIGDTTGLPIRVDSRALEEIGLSNDQPVSLSLKDVPLRSFLNLMLRELDLTYMTADSVLQITTIEAAEQNLQNRIYWLEGTGLPIGDFQSIIDLIQTSIVPDTWEALGGPSTISPVTQGYGNRPAILVSTVYPIHEQIAQLLEALREAHVGADPVISPETDSP
jgi:hypothetical protein